MRIVHRHVLPRLQIAHGFPGMWGDVGRQRTVFLRRWLVQLLLACRRSLESRSKIGWWCWLVLVPFACCRRENNGKGFCGWGFVIFQALWHPVPPMTHNHNEWVHGSKHVQKISKQWFHLVCQRDHSSATVELLRKIIWQHCTKSSAFSICRILSWHFWLVVLWRCNVGHPPLMCLLLRSTEFAKWM